MTLAVFVGGFATGNAAAQDIVPHPGGDIGLPVAGLSVEDQALFRLGRSVFRRVFTPAGQGATGFDGVGPLMNATSCAGCHVNDGRGGPPPAGGKAYDQASMLLKLARISDAGLQPDPVYGLQMQDRALDGIAPEGRIGVAYERTSFTYPDGTVTDLRKPVFSVLDPGYGPLDIRTVFRPRIAPPMFGLGLLEAIPATALAELEDPDDANGDGISGRLRWVTSQKTGDLAPGRFGWKAVQATLEDQIAAALVLDMGLSSPLSADAHGDCTARQTRCRAQPTGQSAAFEGLELHTAPFSWLAHYARNLGVPAPRPGSGDPDAALLFAKLGCAGCHRPSFTLPKPPRGGDIASGTLRPYSDMLLHDLGEELADAAADRDVAAREWRTPPLWAVGLSEQISGQRGLLHDGRARNVEEAILWHGGEAAPSRGRFAALSGAERQALIDFVNSL